MIGRMLLDVNIFNLEKNLKEMEADDDKRIKDKIFYNKCLMQGMELLLGIKRFFVMNRESEKNMSQKGDRRPVWAGGENSIPA